MWDKIITQNGAGLACTVFTNDVGHKTELKPENKVQSAPFFANNGTYSSGNVTRSSSCRCLFLRNCPRSR